MIDAVNPPDVWSPFSAFSMAVLQGKGQIVHLKGQVPLDKAGLLVGKGDMRLQVRQTLANIQTTLQSLGGTTKDVLSVTHYATDIEKFLKTRDIRMEFFAPPYPVTTTVQVARLYDPDILIEMTAIAEIPLERLKRPAQSA